MHKEFNSATYTEEFFGTKVALHGLNPEVINDRLNTMAEVSTDTGRDYVASEAVVEPDSESVGIEPMSIMQITLFYEPYLYSSEGVNPHN